MFYCYKITCNSNGKVYVGITGGSIEKRFSQHTRAARKKPVLALHRAIAKHGVENFTVEKLAEFSDADSAKLFEVEAIATLNTMLPNGYNMTIGGDGCVVLCDESIKKKSDAISSLHKDKDFKDRHRRGILASITEERNKKVSMRLKGRKMHPNAQAAIMDAKKTPEYRLIAKEAASKTWAKEGYKEAWVKSKLEKHILTAEKFPIRGDGLIFSSTRSAARYMREHGFDTAAPNNICLACNKKSAKSYGFEWGWISGDQARASERGII